jgi:protein O-mannosyl-transferase
MNKQKPRKPSLKTEVSRTVKPVAAKPFNTWLWALIIFIMAFLLYANSIPHGYILDDSGVLKDNWVVKRGIDGIPLILTTPYRYGVSLLTDNLYRPLSMVMFAVEWQLYPNTPSVSHLVNVVFFALTCSLLLIVLRKLFIKYHPLLALFTCLLWMAHPVHTEVVANIKSRDEIMSVFFLLLAILGFLEFLNKGKIAYLLGAIFAYLLGFFSKEGIITFLVIFPLIGWYYTPAGMKKNLLASATFILPALVYILVRHVILSTYGKPSLSMPVPDNLLVAAPDIVTRWATAVLIMGKYMALLLIPHQLVSDYSYNQIPIVGWSNPLVLLSFLVYAAGIGFLILKIRSKSPAVLGIFWFLVTMSIYSNLIMLIGSSFAERFLYLPSLGFCILLSWLILLLFRIKTGDTSNADLKNLLGRNIFSWVLVGFILTLFSIKTIARNSEWDTQWSLFSADVLRSPNSTHLHYYWGLTIRDKAKEQTDPAAYRELMEKAVQEFKTAVSIYKYYPECYEQLGLAYFRLGNNDESLKNYEEAVKLNPESATCYSNQGIIYFNRGQYQKAMELYQKAISVDPNYDDAYFNLGSVYGFMGQYEPAIRNFKKCLEFRPDYAQAYYYIGITYRSLKNETEAQKYLDKAYQLDPRLKK